MDCLPQPGNNGNVQLASITIFQEKRNIIPDADISMVDIFIVQISLI